MRDTIIKTIHQIMSQDKLTYFLTGDVGYNTVEKLEESFGRRFINMGVAEQNMMGVASGLALSGNTIFVYSIIPFVTSRCFEQVRDDICYHNLNVTIIGIGSGMTYGVLGSTHFALEDVAIMRALPNMTIISPADATEAGQAMYAAYKHNGPVYFRVEKRGEPAVFDTNYKFKIGKAVVIEKGKDIAIFSTGTHTYIAQESAKIIRKKYNLSGSIVHFGSIKPIDAPAIVKAAQGKKMVFSLEEHSVIGGLGSAVAEVLSERLNTPPLIRLGTKDQFINHVGQQAYLRKKLGLDAEGVVKTIVTTLKQQLTIPTL